MARIETTKVAFECDFCGKMHKQFVEGRTVISDQTLNFMIYGDAGLQVKVIIDPYHPYAKAPPCLCKKCTAEVVGRVLERLEEGK